MQHRFTGKPGETCSAHDDQRKRTMQKFPVECDNLGAKIIDVLVRLVPPVDILKDDDEKNERTEIDGNTQPMQCGERRLYETQSSR